METTSTRPDSMPESQSAGADRLPRPPLAVLLREGFRWFMDRLNEDAGSLGEPRVSAAAAVVVSHLHPDGSRPADIARAMGVTRQHVHAVVRELVDSDVVRLVPDPVSRRDRLIIPTQHGEARRQRAVERLSTLETELSERVGSVELEHLRATLTQLWNPRPAGGLARVQREPER